MEYFVEVSTLKKGFKTFVSVFLKDVKMSHERLWYPGVRRDYLKKNNKVEHIFRNQNSWITNNFSLDREKIPYFFGKGSPNTKMN